MKPWQRNLYRIIYEAETPAGKAFDLALLVAILASVGAVIAESIPEVEAAYGPLLRQIEWVFTGLFTIEYVLRILCVRRPPAYIFSFFGIVDLLAILPAYAGLYFDGAHSLTVVRALRLLRVFRILKLMRFLGEARILWIGLRASIPKITVFLGSVITVSVIAGAAMFLVEGPEHGYTSIPKGFYWAVVTLTTVGFGDITPQTALGQALAVVLMILGYGVIAVPAGIVSAQINRAHSVGDTFRCHQCGSEGLGEGSAYCRFCGARLE